MQLKAIPDFLVFDENTDSQLKEINVKLDKGFHFHITKIESPYGFDFIPNNGKSFPPSTNIRCKKSNSVKATNQNLVAYIYGLLNDEPIHFPIALFVRKKTGYKLVPNNTHFVYSPEIKNISQKYTLHLLDYEPKKDLRIKTDHFSMLARIINQSKKLDQDITSEINFSISLSDELNISDLFGVHYITFIDEDKKFLKIPFYFTSINGNGKYYENY